MRTSMAFVLFTVICSSNIHIEGVAAFPLKQGSRERVTMLRYTYNAYPVNLLKPSGYFTYRQV